MSPAGKRRVDEGERQGGFAGRMLAEWRRLGWARRDERLVVAVSGGADSVALLLALEELLKTGKLEVEVTTAHLDHGLRGEQGTADARWVEEWSRSLGFDVLIGRASVGDRARAGRDNLEQSARRARYEFLSEVARANQASAVLVAHTLDDQAETVLLRLLRGSGSDGAGGMRPERMLEEGSEISLRRPLLNWARRADTEGFCRKRGVEFRIDAMNEDERFARVRVRRRLVPLLETFNPRAVEALARAAGLLREDSDVLELFASNLLEEARAKTLSKADDTAHACRETPAGDVEQSPTDEGEALKSAWPLQVAVLLSALPALRRRALRQWLARGRGGLRRIEFTHMLAVEKLLEGTRGGRVAELPGGSIVERRRGMLMFRREDER